MIGLLRSRPWDKEISGRNRSAKIKVLQNIEVAFIPDGVNDYLLINM
jgi:hypothetical protein